MEIKKANSKILHPDVIRHVIEFAEGKRGAPVDRILWKFYDEDPFNRNTTRTVGGRVGGIIDTWYNELLGGGQSQESGDVESIMSNFESKADELTRGVTKGLQDYNRKARFIGNLKRKIGSILNSNMRYQAKKSAVDNLNRLITKLEKEIGTDFLPFAYKQSRKAKDLDKIEVVIADEQDMIDGSIYYENDNYNPKYYSTDTGALEILPDASAAIIYFMTYPRFGESNRYNDTHQLYNVNFSDVPKEAEVTLFYGIPTQARELVYIQMALNLIQYYMSDFVHEEEDTELSNLLGAQVVSLDRDKKEHLQFVVSSFGNDQLGEK